MTLENVSPKHAGTYTCTAANGNGNPLWRKDGEVIKKDKNPPFGSKYSLSINSVER